MALSSDVEVAVAAARAGAAVVRASYGKPLARFEKGPGDFATSADIDAEQAILAVLREHRPGDAVVAEESGRTGGSGSEESEMSGLRPATRDTSPPAERVWLVDPLCGTLNFAAQTPLVAVNVALRDGPAACADPFSGEVFSTAGELMPSARSRLVEVDLDSGSATTALLTDPTFRELFSPRVVSTSLALAWVAVGRRAAYVVDRDVRDSVHFAAGIALCRAAGCVVTGLSGEPLHRDGLIAAADEVTHRALVDILARNL